MKYVLTNQVQCNRQCQYPHAMRSANQTEPNRILQSSKAVTRWSPVNLPIVLITWSIWLEMRCRRGSLSASYALSAASQGPILAR